MNQEKRNKINARYLQNLQKRYGLTKSSDYKAMCSTGIPKSENAKILTHEFILTRRRGRITCREVYTYRWTPQATNIRREYHTTKNGIPSIPKKPAKQNEKISKKTLLESRPYSEYHKKLVQNLYGNNTAERIIKQQAFEAAHESKITKLIDKLKDIKMSIKLRYMEQRPYKIVISMNDDKEFKVSYSNLPIKQLTEIVSKLHDKLANKYENYNSITIIDRRSLEKKTFINHKPEIKQAA